jgi:nicotinate dehydrogenase subunit A
MQLSVNGIARNLQAEGDTPLLYALRNDLRLVGTRFGCGNGQCGACMVLIDGRPATACNTPLWSIEGKAVTTVEGLGDKGALHPVQQALIDAQAAQCGYCMSGIAVSAVALLSSNPHPHEGQIREALDRNLCRCGSHNRVVRAILKAAAR